ncbi:MAG: hypothetical protein AAGA81_12880, partial [Acidobacteriota bacterium]
MKHVLSVLSGFALWTALFLTGNQVLFRAFRARFDENMVTTDTAVLALTLGLTVLYSLAAGSLTARLAPGAPLGHAAALGAVQTLIGIGVQSAYWSAIPLWSHLG